MNPWVLITGSATIFYSLGRALPLFSAPKIFFSSLGTKHKLKSSAGLGRDDSNGCCVLPSSSPTLLLLYPRDGWWKKKLKFCPTYVKRVVFYAVSYVRPGEREGGPGELYVLDVIITGCMVT